MKAYKGFNKDMTCRDFQYREGGEYETNNKLREALTKILNLTNSLDENCGVDPVEIRDIARSALAAPPRNCDVGTVADQRKRYAKICQHNCDRCALQDDRALKGGCEFSWEQLPYEEGGAK